MLMHLSVGKRGLAGIVTALAILALPQALQGQDKDKEKKSDSSESVKFDSVDGVELRGTFYPAAKAKAPPVLMLHRYGGNRQGWENAAEKLQDKGFAVLTFDFRGHGESTKISQDFWKLAANANHIRGGNKPDKKTIRHSEFRADYLPMLVNDIAAAKRYLDKQNDAGLCNSSNLILVGAEEGAALGLLWMDTEWDRRPKIQTTLNRWIYDPQGKPFGEDIAAAIWISPTSGLSGKSVSGWLRDHKEIREKIPMVFYASKEDPSGSAAATKLFDDLKRQGKMDLTFLQLIKGGKARGVELVNSKDFKLPEDFKKYLEAVNDKKGVNAWKMRDAEKGPLAELVPLQRYGFSQLIN
jgi:alpha-beta hydrolase superfamily lysophospholipase